MTSVPVSAIREHSALDPCDPVHQETIDIEPINVSGISVAAGEKRSRSVRYRRHGNLYVWQPCLMPRPLNL